MPPTHANVIISLAPLQPPSLPSFEGCGITGAEGFVSSPATSAANIAAAAAAAGEDEDSNSIAVTAAVKRKRRKGTFTPDVRAILRFL